MKKDMGETADEQIEEETFDKILQKFDVIGRDKLAINEIDKYMKTVIKQNPQDR
jgi:ferritin